MLPGNAIGGGYEQIAVHILQVFFGKKMATYYSFRSFSTIYIKIPNMSKEYKRRTRHLSQKTRQKISKTLTGRRKSADHSRHIAEGMKKYWASVPDNNEESDL